MPEGRVAAVLPLAFLGAAWFAPRWLVGPPFAAKVRLFVNAEEKLLSAVTAAELLSLVGRELAVGGGGRTGRVGGGCIGYGSGGGHIGRDSGGGRIRRGGGGGRGASG